MREVCELRINKTYEGLLPTSITGRDLGPVVKIEIEKGSPEYEMIGRIAQTLKPVNMESFFFGWGIKRIYSRSEVSQAKLFHVIIDNVFEPTGEECGTQYDETAGCEICGSNRKQVGPLILKKNTIPKKDIAKTIGGEVVASRKFVDVVSKNNLKGLVFTPINFEKGIADYYQMNFSAEIELSDQTVAGINPFDLSTSSDREIYKCSNGHTIGLNLLSEPHVANDRLIIGVDFFESKQKIGVKRGLLRPESLYFCTPNFREIIKKEKLKGFHFEIAYID